MLTIEEKKLRKKEYDKRKREENPEKYREKNRKWIMENREKHREICNNWRKRNPEKDSASGKKWAKNHPVEHRERGRKWILNNQEKAIRNSRKSNLKRAFGITYETYEQILEKQNGVCAICGNKNKNGRMLAVDHDHNTNKNRGLLCVACNLGLGMFKENKDNLVSAISYLMEWNVGQSEECILESQGEK